ncbi:cytochrome P450 4C1-like [Spodoptera litura]|uniref:Cytochrome P450 4C1-like n=1 Tax=Spodoptera litura TaxID=69820 RepID=A0A9J7E933_SPOLT|nr:cytochrome P450 4C1-like [Spodoptera litura]
MIFELLLAALVAAVVWLIFFRDDDNPVDKLPGPPRKPWIGNAWELLQMPSDKLLDILVDYTNKYGDRYVFKVFSLRVLHISGPPDVETVLSHSKNIKKSAPYDFLKGWLGTGLLLSTGLHWHKRRKILTPTFHFNILKNFAHVIEEKTQDLVKMLKDKNGADVSLMPTISDFTLFTICETAMGTKLDDDKTSATVDYKNAILNIGMQMLARITRFWLHNDFVFNNSSRGKEFNKTLEVARAFADNVIMDRKAQRTQNKREETAIADASDGIGTKKRLAMLDLLLEAEEKGEIDMDGIRDEVNTFMFEGHDTTALALTFGLMLLADHEDVQERIYEECQTILGDSEHVTMSNLSDMKYLEAVIKEILRLYPSVPFIGREITEDFKLGDITVKKGTTVDVHIYELHRRADMFPEPEKFMPERFLGTEMKHPYAYVPFSAGPRNCIGQRFAMQEMKTTLSELVRHFKIVPKVKGARPRIMADLVLRPVDPIYVKFIPR